MATINKKLIHFRSLSDFETRLAAGDILSTSIVWIKDAKKIWTHGTYYDCNGGGGSGSYVPMPETFVEQGGTLDYTLLPNSSVYAFLVGSGRVSIYIQEPTSFDVVNEYTMIFRTFGFGNAITLDKTIIWANDNPPVLDDSVAEILEISVKCVNADNYDGVQYLGTWTKYNV